MSCGLFEIKSRPDGDILEMSRSDNSFLVWFYRLDGFNVSRSFDKEKKILDNDAFEQ